MAALKIAVKRRLARFWAVALVLLVIGLAGIGTGRNWAHEFDRRVLHERLMDSLSRLRADEDWATAEPLRQPQDYTWRQAASHPVRIAHALGDAALPTANTLGAMRRSHQAGLRFFEVDLLDQDGVLRCHHGPNAAPPLQPDSCRLETLLDALADDSWLVLDIKTDFLSTGQHVVNLLRQRDQSRRVIFQLYQPDQAAMFNRWQSQLPLPGPIVTAYLAHRRIDHVAAHAARIGAQVLTVPMERMVALHQRPRGLALYVHPVHDCEAWRTAEAEHADGVYMRGALNCADVR
jgi:hypothetical protein